jgi:hypothetical protein
MLLLLHAMFCVKRDEHFCRPLHVAMQSGLYLHPAFAGDWRVVSEDSESFPTRPFLLIVCSRRIFTRRFR